MSIHLYRCILTTSIFFSDLQKFKKTKNTTTNSLSIPLLSIGFGGSYVTFFFFQESGCRGYFSAWSFSGRHSGCNLGLLFQWTVHDRRRSLGATSRFGPWLLQLGARFLFPQGVPFRIWPDPWNEPENRPINAPKGNSSEPTPVF